MTQNTQSEKSQLGQRELQCTLIGAGRGVHDAPHSLRLGLAAQHALVSGETVQDFGREVMAQVEKVAEPV
ncbi:hypothetical protein [Deinococcus sp. UYEF24]